MSGFGSKQSFCRQSNIITRDKWLLHDAFPKGAGMSGEWYSQISRKDQFRAFYSGVDLRKPVREDNDHNGEAYATQSYAA